MPRVVVVGGGIAGIYLAHLLADAFEVVVVDPQDRHQFIIGVPMAMAGMVDFEQLLFPFTSMKKVQFVQSKAIGVEDRCVRLADGNSPRVCGRYLVLAPGALRIGSAEYWNVKGAQAIYEAVKKAPAVRFIVNEYNPVMGFQEIAYAIKARHPEKAVSVHSVYVSPDFQNVLSLWARWAREVGIEVSDEPPEYKPGELHISVPGVRPHPLVSTLKINHLTFEAGPGVFVIGDSASAKLGLPPIGWAALWQATVVAKTIRSLENTGVVELEVSDWASVDTQDKFYKWFAYRMTTGTPLTHLKGLYDVWKNKVWASL